jgi:hypothetical protein
MRPARRAGTPKNHRWASAARSAHSVQTQPYTELYSINKVRMAPLNSGFHLRSASGRHSQQQRALHKWAASALRLFRQTQRPALTYCIKHPCTAVRQHVCSLGDTAPGCATGVQMAVSGAHTNVPRPRIVSDDAFSSNTAAAQVSVVQAPYARPQAASAGQQCAHTGARRHSSSAWKARQLCRYVNMTAARMGEARRTRTSR